MIRVIIERWLMPGCEDVFLAAMRELRHDAIHAEGYISGETLRDCDDALHWVVISTWRTLPHWSQWAVCRAREEAVERIGSLLARPARVTVLEPV
jgi:heme-degrading monooxygenase HmoA